MSARWIRISWDPESGRLNVQSNLQNAEAVGILESAKFALLQSAAKGVPQPATPTDDDPMKLTTRMPDLARTVA